MPNVKRKNASPKRKIEKVSAMPPTTDTALPTPRERLVELLNERPVHERDLFGTRVSTRALEAMTSQEIHDLQFIFEAMDTHGRSYLGAVDLRRAMRALGFKITKLQAQQIVRSSGKNCKNMVNFNEFLNVVIAHQGDATDIIEEICAGFKLITGDNTEEISVEHLRRASKACGLSFTSQELGKMIDEADANGDGFVGQQEFIQVMLKTNLFREPT